MRRMIVALWAAIAAAGASAQDHLVVHGLSSHSGTREDGQPYQERNIGAGWRRTYSPTWAAQAGLYQNSYNRLSVYGLGEWTPLRAGQVTATSYHALGSRLLNVHVATRSPMELVAPSAESAWYPEEEFDQVPVTLKSASPLSMIRVVPATGV